MDTFLLAVAVVVCVLILLPMYRAAFGPTSYDRIIGAGFVGTKTIILLVLMGFIYKRLDMFIDIALTYSLLNFLVTLVITKYFLRRGAQ